MGRKQGKVTQWQEGKLASGRGKGRFPRFLHSLAKVRHALLLGILRFSAFAGALLKTGAGGLR